MASSAAKSLHSTSMRSMPAGRAQGSKKLHSPRGLDGPIRANHISGSGKVFVWKRGLLSKVHSLEVVENLEIVEILEIPPAKKPLS